MIKLFNKSQSHCLYVTHQRANGTALAGTEGKDFLDEGISFSVSE